jgi:glycosyltransferase involved in cell wall biosynthesis
MDRCPEICDEYATKDRRIVVIHQKNTGTAHARDAGIQKAQGDFISFVDSDDWFEANAMELLYKNQKKTDADVVIGGIRDVYKKYSSYIPFPEIDNETNYLTYYFLNRCRNMISKICRKELFNDYFVPNTNIGEDAIVMVQIFSKLKPGKLQKVNAAIYNYDHRTMGVTKKYVHNYKNYLEDPVIKCRLWIEKYINNFEQDSVIKSAFTFYFLTEGLYPYLRYNKKISKEDVNIFYEKYFKNCIYKNVMNSHTKYLFICFHHSILLGFFYRNLLNFFTAIKKIVRK